MTITASENLYPTLGNIITGLCALVGVTSVNASAVDAVTVRGFRVAGSHNVADAIRALQRAYFFDLVAIDGSLVVVLRGGVSAATINRTDMVRGSEAKFGTVREQGIEFAKKLHVVYSNAESDYTPTKQTSEQRSDDIRSVTELSIELPLNLLDADAAQVADKLHKVAWAEQQGTVKFSTSEKFAYLTASDIITVETETGVFRRVRIQKDVFVDGMLQLEVVVDRASAYASAVVAPIPTDPLEPGTNLPGDTTYEIMDLPALRQSHDTLHVYISATGGSLWGGAVIEQLIDTEWISKGSITYPETMGTTLEELPIHAIGIDVTNTLLVTVSDTDMATITQAEFDAGGNTALVDDELIQFRDVAQEGNDFRISYLKRGALNTTPDTNASSSRFVKLVLPTVVPLTSGDIGDTLTFRVYTFGTIPAVSDESSFVFAGNSQIEWEPLNATIEKVGQTWVLEWEHNERIGAPGASVISQHWLDFELVFDDGATTHSVFTLLENMTYSKSEQKVDFGGAVSSWTSVTIYGRNRFTGRGTPAVFQDITGDTLLLESGGTLLFESGGALLLEI